MLVRPADRERSQCFQSGGSLEEESIASAVARLYGGLGATLQWGDWGPDAKPHEYGEDFAKLVL